MTKEEAAEIINAEFDEIELHSTSMVNVNLEDMMEWINLK